MTQETSTDNDGLHGPQEKSGQIGLKAGLHAITVTFFERDGGELLEVSYAGPNLGKTAIPASALRRAGTGAPVAASPLREPENPANITGGLNYAYYQGVWGALPDFASLTSVTTGTVGTFDVAPRPSTPLPTMARSCLSAISWS